MPSALKAARGNPGRRALNSEEPARRPLKRMPLAPGFLDRAGKRAWSYYGRLFITDGILTARDVPMFEAWCFYYSKRDEAARAVNDSGLVVKAGGKTGAVGNPYINPFMGVYSMCNKAMHQIAIEFGASPASSTKIRTLNPAQQSLFGGDWLDSDDEEDGTTHAN